MQLVRVSLPGDKNSSAASNRLLLQVQKREMEEGAKAIPRYRESKLEQGAPLAPALGTTDTNRSPWGTASQLSTTT